MCLVQVPADPGQWLVQYSGVQKHGFGVGHSRSATFDQRYAPTINRNSSDYARNPARPLQPGPGPDRDTRGREMSDSVPAPILVVGPGGPAGREILAALLEAGVAIIAVSPDVPEYSRPNLTWMQHDLAREHARVQAHVMVCAGADALSLAARQARAMPRLRRIVALSSASVVVKQRSADPDERAEVGLLVEAEQALAAMAEKRGFDMIWVASLFSHLPDRLFRAWLTKLHALLAPGGVLCFSVRDESQFVGQMPAEGFVYRPESEQIPIDASIYGTAGPASIMSGRPSIPASPRLWNARESRARWPWSRTCIFFLTLKDRHRSVPTGFAADPGVGGPDALQRRRPDSHRGLGLLAGWKQTRRSRSSHRWRSGTHHDRHRAPGCRPGLRQPGARPQRFRFQRHGG